MRSAQQTVWPALHCIAQWLMSHDKQRTGNANSSYMSKLQALMSHQLLLTPLPHVVFTAGRPRQAPGRHVAAAPAVTCL